MSPRGPQPGLFTTERQGSIFIVTPAPDLADLLRDGYEETQKLLEDLRDPTITDLIVDLQQTTYFPTDFLALLMKVWKRVSGRNGTLALCNISTLGRETLAICRLDTLWTIYPSRAEAFAAIGK